MVSSDIAVGAPCAEKLFEKRTQIWFYVGKCVKYDYTLCPK